MCGIAGVIVVTEARDAAERARLITRPHEAAIPEQWLDALDASIRHRGPDGQGRFRDRAIREDGAIIDVALVHRRLSILDHAGGAQPMVSLRGPAPKGAASASSPDHAFASERSALPPPKLFQGKPNAAVEYRDLPARPEDDLVAVVFNGCIYNHRELRADLAAAGHRFESDHSDTEVLLHGWRAWGGLMCPRLDGMFSWVVWDRARAGLASTRDRYGEKPLYARTGVHCGAMVGAACSAIPGLRHLPLDPPAGPKGQGAASAVSDSLTQWIRYGWSATLPLPSYFENTPGVLAGSGSFAALGLNPSCQRSASLNNWMHPWRTLPTDRTRHIKPEELDGLVSQSVQTRLEADVPIGVFLSGGIDSSLVASYAAAHQPNVAAFSVQMPDARLDESAAAASVARHLGLRHHILECDPRAAEDLVRLVGEVGLPFGDSSLLPTYWVARTARQNVTVALSGDGGDEMFGGYERYRAARYFALMGIARFGLRLLPDQIQTLGIEPTDYRSRRSRFLSAAAHQGANDLLSIFPTPLLRSLGIHEPSMLSVLRRDSPHLIPLWPLYALARGMSELFAPIGELASHRGTASAIRSDLLRYLPEDIFRKVDTATMSSALESRSPLVSLCVSDAATNAPIPCLMPHGQRKGLLKQVARKYLPDSIINRPKQGFAIPIGEWFRSDYGGLRTLLLDRLNSHEPFGPPSLGINLNMRFVRQMLDEHLGTGPSGLVRRDHSQRLYMLLVLSIWADTQAPPP